MFLVPLKGLPDLKSVDRNEGLYHDETEPYVHLGSERQGGEIER
jgi:hypothetical protein